MPPPCHSHYPRARRSPRPPQSNSGIAKRVYVRSRGAALSALNRVVAADQASLTRLPTQPSRSPLPGPSARSSTPPSAALTPTPGAGEEFFTLSSFSRPSSPPTPGPSTEGHRGRCPTRGDEGEADCPTAAGPQTGNGKPGPQTYQRHRYLPKGTGSATGKAGPCPTDPRLPSTVV
ncbi:unnamed protein product [Arctia plantaginis]|uniref:Uncharacterized protein n=1 Tax=Arctia plantaginis TaxID=874455 RepID=A0A8S1AJT0_ARCPL|nr:unnamed protein product [Arctia plantaginis]